MLCHFTVLILSIKIEVFTLRPLFREMLCVCLCRYFNQKIVDFLFCPKYGIEFAISFDRAVKCNTLEPSHNHEVALGLMKHLFQLLRTQGAVFSVILIRYIEQENFPQSKSKENIFVSFIRFAVLIDNTFVLSVDLVRVGVPKILEEAFSPKIGYFGNLFREVTNFFHQNILGFFRMKFWKQVLIDLGVICGKECLFIYVCQKNIAHLKQQQIIIIKQKDYLTISKVFAWLIVIGSREG